MSQHYLDGQFITGVGPSFTAINPADGCTIWEGFEATEKEIKDASDAAHQALPSWAALDFETRANYVKSFTSIVEKRQTELQHLIAKATGKPLWEAFMEVTAVLCKGAFSIEAYQTRTKAEYFPTKESNNHIRYKPHGVVGVLGPFNFPAHLANGHLLPALLAGNTIVYKPSEYTPQVAAFMMECFHDSQFPPGVINMIQGGRVAGEILLEQDLQGVYFTGSYQTGLKINEMFAKRPEVIVALEMGGNNPLIIDKVKDVNAAVYHALISSFITAGQRCTCARRLFIPKGDAGDHFLNQFTKSAKALRVGAYEETPEPFMGPVIHYKHALSHLKSLDTLKKQGGTVLLPMTLLKEGTGFLTPGIIDMTGIKVPDEEYFAPLVQVYRYDDFEEALTLANQTRYGLVAALFSDDESRYKEFYNTIRAGLINFNKPTTGAASRLPFGGVGISGNHRPSAYFAADYCAYPIASMEQSQLSLPSLPFPGMGF